MLLQSAAVIGECRCHRLKEHQSGEQEQDERAGTFTVHYISLLWYLVRRLSKCAGSGIEGPEPLTVWLVCPGPRLAVVVAAHLLGAIFQPLPMCQQHPAL